ncbi:hypothetical protein [Leisingera sp. ANG-M6]|nr:hypothetical protein [Leisingera sp. ANG-M6]
MAKFPLQSRRQAKWGLTKRPLAREGDEKNRGKHDLMSALNQLGGQI